ncbi:MAG: helix-turn-helix domain-containing protein [Candidatus Nanopelagicales bacterium]
MSAPELLRAARSSRAVSQRELARRAQIAQPRIAEVEAGRHDTTVSRLEQLLAAMGQRLVVLTTTSPPVYEAATAIRDALADGDQDGALREVIQVADDLARADGATCVALALTRPGPVGDRRWDALLAAVVDHRLTERGLPRPRWVDDPAYRLDEPWDVEELTELQAAARAATPDAISSHGVFLAAEELGSV